MPEKRRRLGRTLFYLLGLSLLAGLLSLRTELAREELCTLARRQLPALTGLEVGLGRCEVEPFTQTVTLHGLSLRLPGSEQPLLAAQEATVSFGWIAPFTSRVVVDSVKVSRPQVKLDLRGPSSPSVKRNGCALDVFDRLKLWRADVRSGDLELALPDGELLFLRGVDLSWKTRRGEGEFQLSASRGSLTRPGARSLSLSRFELDGRLSPDDGSLEILRGELVVDELSLTVSGRIDSLCTPQLGLQAQLFVPIPAAASLVGYDGNAKGHLWANVGLTGKPSAPQVSFEVVTSGAELDRFAPGDLRVRGRLKDDELTLDALDFEAGAGTVHAEGAITLSGNFPLKLKVATDGASFGQLLARAGIPGSWVEFPATTRGSFSGHLFPQRLITGDAELESGRFILATRAFDGPAAAGQDILEFRQANAKLSVRVLPDRVELKNINVRTAGSEVEGDVTLHYDSARGILVHGRATKLALEDFGKLAGLDWGGSGEAEFDVTTARSDVQVNASLRLRDFSFWKFSLGVVQGGLHFSDDTLTFPALSGQKGKSSYQGTAELKFPKAGNPMHARADVQLTSGRVEDLVEMMAGLNSSVPLFKNVLTGSVKGTVHIDSPTDALDGRVELDFADARYYGRRFGDGKMVLRFDRGEAAVLEPLTLRGPLGRTFVDGTFRFDGTLDYRFGAELKLHEALLTEADGALQGDLTLGGHVEGDATMPIVVAYLTSPHVLLSGRDLGPMHLEGRIEGKDAQLFGKPFADARLFLKSKLREPFPYDANFTLSLPDLKPLLPRAVAAQGLSGAVSGSARVQGLMFDNSAIEASGQLEQVKVTRGDFEGRNEAPLTFEYAKGVLSVDPVTLRGPNTELTLAGKIGPALLDMELKGAVDLRLVESFVPAIERAGGKLELSAAARGTPKDPSVLGTAELKDARLSLRDQPYALKGVSGRLEFSERRVLLQDFTGQLNGGRVGLRGDLRISKLQLVQLEVGVQLDGITAYVTEELPLTASGELLLYGKPEALQLSGGIDIEKLRYDKALDLDLLLTEAKKSRRRMGDDPTEWLSFDVSVKATGDVRIENNLARAKLSGALKLTGTNLKPGLLGSLEAQPGSSLVFRGNQFQVSQGLLEFRDRRSVDALFDLRAETSVREYVVRLHAFGRAADPQVILSSEPELPEGDILSLLTLGVTSRDQASAAGTGAGLAAEALFAASGLDKQVQRFLPKNAVLRDLSFHLSTTYNDVTGLVEPTAQLESKFLTEQLKLQMTQPVSGRGTRAQAEYRFDNQLSAQAQWDNENSEYSFGNLGFGLKLRWETD